MIVTEDFPRVRSEFSEEIAWGPLSQALQRYELTAPRISGPIIGMSHAVGCFHADRSSLIVRVDGGHLEAPAEELVRRLESDAATHLEINVCSPARYVRGVISWLEKEQRSGYLQRSFTTAMLLAAVSDEEVWAWLVSPNGIAHGSPASMVFGSTDLRYPVLRQLGVMGTRRFSPPGVEIIDRASSIFPIGMSNGYESIRVRIAARELVMALEQACLPFGPLPARPIGLVELWQLDAAWRHGLPGPAVVIGHVEVEDLSVPRGLRLREVPLTDGRVSLPPARSLT